ncbi:8-oxo-dGTP diphosphatase [Patescibacteria group bacterium]
MKSSVLVFLLRKGKGGVLEVCLGKRKTNYARGLWNAPGGKVKAKEDILDSAIREVEEEVGLNIEREELVKKGEITYYEPAGNWLVHAFICKKWKGEIKETDEMLPLWFSLNELPSNDMWENDQLWWPKVLCGKKIKGKIWHNKDYKVIKSVLKEVDELT